MAPGVLPKGGAGAGPLVNGGRSNTSEIPLDGAETRNSTTNDIAYTPPLETVQEFKVMTNMFSSEFGRSGGRGVAVATRSGTNELHGAEERSMKLRTSPLPDDALANLGPLKPLVGAWFGNKGFNLRTFARSCPRSIRASK